MPRIKNPTEWDLFCLPLGRVLTAGEEVEVEVEKALEVVESTGVFRILGLDRSKLKAATETAATRTTVQRGSELVEVDEAPERETR